MAKPASVEAYMATLPEHMRAALENLRATIRAAAPEATELIAYDMPAFKANGRFLVSFSAFKNHCSLFPASGAVLAAHGEALKPYLSGKATLRFDPDQPIPEALVTEIVRIRLAEIAAPPRPW
jgi:uncharacterized protein YdhG (YjbR/CyaY superfamily)